MRAVRNIAQKQQQQQQTLAKVGDACLWKKKFLLFEWKVF